MAIVLETSPALVFNSLAASVTTATFDAPSGSLLLACAMLDSPALSNSGDALTWTQRNSQTNDSIWTAPVAAERTGMTVTLAPSGGGSQQMALSVYVLTGADLGSPVAATGSGTSSTANVTVNGYTSTIVGSRGFAIARDTAAQGAPTSADIEQSWFGTLNRGGMSITKAANTAILSTVTFDLDNALGGTATWAWIAAEVIPTQSQPPIRMWTPPTAVHRASRW